MKLNTLLLTIIFSFNLFQCKKKRLQETVAEPDSTTQENLTESDMNQMIKSISALKNDASITEATFQGSFKVEVNEEKKDYPYPCLTFEVDKAITRIDYLVCDKNAGSCDENINERKGAFFPIPNQDKKIIRCIPSIVEGPKIAKTRFCVDRKINQCSDWMSNSFDQPHIEDLALQALDLERESLDQDLFHKGEDVISVLKAYQEDVNTYVKEESFDSQLMEKKKALAVIVSNDIILGPSVIGDFLMRSDWTKEEDSHLGLYGTVYYGSPVQYHTYVEKPRGEYFSGDEDEKAKYRCFFKRGHESFGTHMQLNFAQYFKIYLSFSGISSLPAQQIVSNDFGPMSTSQYLQSNYSEILSKIDDVTKLFELQNIQVGLITAILRYQAPQLGKEKIANLTKLLSSDPNSFTSELQKLNIPSTARSSILSLSQMNLSLLEKECDAVKQTETSKWGTRLLVVGVIGGVASIIGLSIGENFDQFRYWTTSTESTTRSVTKITQEGVVTEGRIISNNGYKFSKLTKGSAVVLGVSLVVGITGALMYNYGLTESRSKALQAVENMTIELDHIASQAASQKEELAEAIEKIKQKS